MNKLQHLCFLFTKDILHVELDALGSERYDNDYCDGSMFIL